MGNVSESIAPLTLGLRLSQGVVHGGLLSTSGQVDTQSSEVGEQTRRVLAKIGGFLARVQSSKSVPSATVWLSDLATFDAMNRVWDRWIDEHNPPARPRVASRLAAPEYNVEVALIAMAGKPQ